MDGVPAIVMEGGKEGRKEGRLAVARTGGRIGAVGCMHGWMDEDGPVLE